MAFQRAVSDIGWAEDTPLFKWYLRSEHAVTVTILSSMHAITPSNACTEVMGTESAFGTRSHEPRVSPLQLFNFNRNYMNNFSLRLFQQPECLGNGIGPKNTEPLASYFPKQPEKLWM